MKRIIYDYENPHIVGKAKRAFSIAKLIVAIIVVSLIIALVYILFFRGDKSCESKGYFMLVAGSFDSRAPADSLASELKSRGGGGYVLEENGYEVIAAVYLSGDEAETVAKRYGWQVKRTNKTTVTFDEKRALSKKAASFCLYPETVIEEVYIIALKLDKGELSASAAVKQVSEVQGKLQSKLTECEKCGLSDKLTQKFTSAYKDMDKFFCGVDEKAAPSSIKYSLIGITLTYNTLLIDLS